MDMYPDPELTPDQKLFLEKLSHRDIERIDLKLLEHTSRTWRKVARIVGMFMEDQASDSQGIPDVYLASRIYALVESGTLDSQGKLGYMRYCEVRTTSRD